MCTQQRWVWPHQSRSQSCRLLTGLRLLDSVPSLQGMSHFWDSQSLILWALRIPGVHEFNSSISYLNLNLTNGVSFPWVTIVIDRGAHCAALQNYGVNVYTGKNISIHAANNYRIQTSWDVWKLYCDFKVWILKHLLPDGGCHVPVDEWGWHAYIPHWS